MIRLLLAVLAVPCLGAPVWWMSSQTPGGGLAQAGIAAVGYVAVLGIAQAVLKGDRNERRTH